MQNHLTYAETNRQTRIGFLNNTLITGGFLMKRPMLITLLVALSVSLSLVGCQNEGTQLTGPESAGKVAPQLLLMPIDAEVQKGLATLPSAETQILQAQGGDLVLSFSTLGRTKKDTLLAFYAGLKFEPWSVNNSFTASVTADPTYLSSTVAMTFGPHGTDFITPASLVVRVKGIDLSWIPAGTVLHLYYDNNGTWEMMAGDVTYDTNTKVLQCLNGKLPHFSRYAFGI
jgi:hypothetical protein